jgi:hypothetical protein
MERLIQLLQLIDADPNIVVKYGFLSDHRNKTVRDASELAADVLITANGMCHWNNIEDLKNAGYDVFPIEEDQFGWLLGGIETRKGIIVYG